MGPATLPGLPCRFGKYELLERIGAGGMAEVHRARLPGIAGFEKIVVIKRLLPHVAREPGLVQMFVDEAKLAALVQHPNVVQVFELDRTDDGELFIVMEWVRGTDLRRLLQTAAIRGVRVPPWFSAYAVARVLDALAYAHELVDERGRRRNVVHRDLAPDNVFVSVLGEIKLGDFGVARDDTRGPEPFAGQLKGKLSYMAPELFLGAPPDHRCDVFSAGVVLWECLVQRALFRGGSARETMELVCSAPRRAPSSIAPDVPAELDALVLAALEPDPARRTPSARELERALLDVLPRLRVDAGSVAVREVLATLSVELTPGRVEATCGASITAEPSGAPATRCSPIAAQPDEVSEELIIDVVSSIDELRSSAQLDGRAASPDAIGPEGVSRGRDPGGGSSDRWRAPPRRRGSLRGSGGT